MRPDRPVSFVPVVSNAPRWSVATFRAMMKHAYHAGVFGKYGEPFMSFLNNTRDEVIAEELRLRDGPSVAQILFEQMLRDVAEYKIRVDAPFVKIGREVRETQLRGAGAGGRPFGSGEHDRDLDHFEVADHYYRLRYVERQTKRRAAQATYHEFWGDSFFRPSSNRALDAFAAKMERWVAEAKQRRQRTA